MKKLLLAALVGVVVLGTLAVGTMTAQNRAREQAQAAETRARVAQMKAQAEHLEQTGRVEEAKRVWQEAQEIMRHSQRDEETFDEVRKRVVQMQAEAEELARKGHAEEAERLQMTAQDLAASVEMRHREIVEEKERGEQLELLEREFHKVEAHLAEATERAERFEREGNEALLHKTHLERDRLLNLLAEIKQHMHERQPHEHEHGDHHEYADRDGRRHDPHQELAELERRIGHMRAAAENLEAAGLGERARDLFEESAEAERNLHRQAEELKGEPHERDVHGEAMGILHEILDNTHVLRKEIAELHEAIAEIREDVDDLEEGLEDEEEEDDDD